MRIWTTTITAAIGLALFAGAARADHMTGVYEGTGTFAGTTLDLLNEGNIVDAAVTGVDQGTLTAKIVGEDIILGVVDLGDIGMLSFTAVWSADGLTFTFNTEDGPVEGFFALVGTPPAAPPPAVAPEPPAVPPAPEPPAAPPAPEPAAPPAGPAKPVAPAEPAPPPAEPAPPPAEPAPAPPAPEAPPAAPAKPAAPEPAPELAPPPAGEMTPPMQIPLVAHFEDEAFAEFYDIVARGLLGTIEDGKVVVSSDRAPGAGSITFQDLAAEGTRATFVDLTASFPLNADDDGIVGAGILIRHSPGEGDGPSFLAFMLTPSGYSIVAWSGTAVTQELGGEMPPGFLNGDRVNLAARETDDGAEFFLNGVSVGSLADSNVTGRNVGLVVFGPGYFTFDNYGLNTLGEIAEGAR